MARAGGAPRQLCAQCGAVGSAGSDGCLPRGRLGATGQQPRPQAPVRTAKGLRRDSLQLHPADLPPNSLSASCKGWAGQRVAFLLEVLGQRTGETPQQSVHLYTFVYFVLEGQWLESHTEIKHKPNADPREL